LSSKAQKCSGERKKKNKEKGSIKFLGAIYLLKKTNCETQAAEKPSAGLPQNIFGGALGTRKKGEGKQRDGKPTNVPQLGEDSGQNQGWWGGRYVQKQPKENPVG